MEVSREDVQRCAQLAHLQLEEGEVEPLRQSMEQLLRHAESLNELDLAEVPPTTHGQVLPMPFREDVVQASLPQDVALKNAPEQARGHFQVPKVLGR